MHPPPGLPIGGIMKKREVKITELNHGFIVVTDIDNGLFIGHSESYAAKDIGEAFAIAARLFDMSIASLGPLPRVGVDEVSTLGR